MKWIDYLIISFKENMKKRIKKIDDNSLQRLFKKQKGLKKTPKYLDEKMIDFLNQKSIIQSNNIKIEKKIKKNPFKIINTSLSIAAVFIIIVFIPFFIYFSKKIKPFVITVKIINGNINKTSDTYISKLNENNELSYGDKIITNKGESCQIQFNDSIVTFIDEKSEIEINKINNKKDVLLNLNKGKILINIKKKIKPHSFSIMTKHAVITAKGTKFAVITDDEKTDVLLSEGVVDIKERSSKIKNIKLKKYGSITISKGKIEKNKILPETEKLFKRINDLKIMNDIIQKQKKDDITWKKIYNQEYLKDKSKNTIIGFAIDNKYVIAQSAISIICFNKNGEIQWNKKYGKELFFMSTPVIYKDKVFVSSINKYFLILDLHTGNEIKKIKSESNVTFGFKSVYENDQVFIPYRNGIYSLNLNNLLISNKPLINFNNATTPLIIKDTIILSSFLKNELAAFTFDNKRKWVLSLNGSSYNSPVLIGNNIYVGDNNGYIYKISLDGKINKKIKLSAGITSTIAGYEDCIYAVTNDGMLFEINFINDSLKEILKVDENTNTSDYLFKHIVMSKNLVLYGNNNGEIVIYDKDQNKIEKTKITDSKISSFIKISEDHYMAGTNTGCIYIIKITN